jgi:plastocyanin
MKSKVLILAFALVLVAAACNKSSNTNVSQTPTPTPTPSVTPNPTATPAPTPTPTASPVVITITSSGYSPSNVTVTAGTKVTFQNNDTKNHWPASNPHPSHTDLPGFDALKNVAPGSSYSYTFTKVGTWGYHDHLFPSQGGKVTVIQ